jgi:hypothetical protein
MYTNAAIVADVMQRERENRIELDRLAHLAARIRACCDPSLFRRLARALLKSDAR